MMPIPTDSFHKFLAVLGLATIGGCFYFWWPLKVEVDNDYAELAVLSERFKTSYKIMAESTNAAVSMINSVRGDRSKLDSVQLAFIDQKMAEAEPASKVAEEILAETTKPLRFAEVRRKRFILVSWILGVVSFLGLVSSCYGFYKWGRSEKSAKN